MMTLASSEDATDAAVCLLADVNLSLGHDDEIGDFASSG